jgi:hypothetical protein
MQCSFAFVIDFSRNGIRHDMPGQLLPTLAALIPRKYLVRREVQAISAVGREAMLELTLNKRWSHGRDLDQRGSRAMKPN